ncbi:hypothetical protein [Paenibacillus arenosi]|uniref:Restriction endonuclease n=1 Tax=Paenibacillus arenosi TaxID=2774142 RepID=A0ABR9AY00_9BACL|nr:hypothetical protein [Paenibacillus arenosi]MBD8498514.1 hypothetical protein [Paenibacillus arenosi]
MIDLSLLRQAMDQNLEFKVKEAFEGKQQLNISYLTSFMAELYKYHPPEKVKWKFKCILTTEEINYSKGKIVHRAELFRDFSSSMCILLISNDKCLVSGLDDHTFDETKAVIYTYENGVEIFKANGKIIEVPNPDSASISIFAKPTFKDLDEALWIYYNKRAKTSICTKLRECWISSDRLRFKAGPEHIMRDSLYYFLDTGLRGSPIVKREQNVDDTDPVDIKVSWSWSNASALIEVKWLGKSFDPNSKKQTKDFSQARAIDGAQQLQNYLKVSNEENPEIYFKGYLVLFDGRRRGLGTSFTTVPKSDQAWYYKEKEIPYPESVQNDSHLQSYRFYLEPTAVAEG